MNSFRLAARHLRPTQPIPTRRAIITTPATKGKQTVKMSTFIIPSSKIPVNSIPDLTQDEFLSFPAFKTWIATLQQSLSRQGHPSHEFHQDPYVLRKIDIQSIDRFGGGRLGFVKLKAEVSNGQGETLPGSVFLRGGSVGMLVSCAQHELNLFYGVLNRVNPFPPSSLRRWPMSRLGTGNMHPPAPASRNYPVQEASCSNFINSSYYHRIIYPVQLRRISVLS